MIDISSPFEIILGAVLIFALALIAFRSKAIDLQGAIAGYAVSFVAFLAGGFGWLVVIVAFFGVSSVLTRFRYDYKLKLGSAQEKSGTRSWPNTFANAGVALGASLLEIYLHEDIFAVAFIGSISAAMSDTIATEVGLLSKSNPRLITNLRKLVKPGTSGGVSSLGEIAAFVSSLAMGILGVILVVPQKFNGSGLVSVFPSVLLGGFAGTTIDSLVGAKFQATSECEVCGALTEENFHHSRPTKLVKGHRFIDNNVVNFIGALSGALVSIALYWIFGSIGLL